ncbi:uncharacterized protein LY89DRAFT_269718 [Mollisia scopiformis]|uniref:Uncharacterized protein n=1 Tax=Mollisia scopiformis TaxID=149040 RepID=A0A132BEJ0_MOLSC|nr:uncharacterized protein LY89DRAFT_269718 [Mollisia scopiformis]KUJ10097.1 hypothetical protein LY89DRAFT_269718 [Mollisia scopiformis]
MTKDQFELTVYHHTLSICIQQAGVVWVEVWEVRVEHPVTNSCNTQSLYEDLKSILQNASFQLNHLFPSIATALKHGPDQQAQLTIFGNLRQDQCRPRVDTSGQSIQFRCNVFQPGAKLASAFIFPSLLDSFQISPFLWKSSCSREPFPAHSRS